MLAADITKNHQILKPRSSASTYVLTQLKEIIGQLKAWQRKAQASRILHHDIEEQGRGLCGVAQATCTVRT